MGLSGRKGRIRLVADYGEVTHFAARSWLALIVKVEFDMWVR